MTQATASQMVEDEAEAMLRKLAVTRADLRCREDLARRCGNDSHQASGVILLGSKVLTWYTRTEKIVTEHCDGALACVSATVTYDVIPGTMIPHAGKWPERVRENVTITVKETDLTKTNNLRNQPTK